MTIKRKLLIPKDDNCAVCQIDYVVDGRFRFVSYLPNSWNGDSGEVGDKDFFASGSVKWDACSHLYFYGQDSVYQKSDSYYHICGGYSFVNHITMMSFILEVAITEMKKEIEYVGVSELDNVRKLNLLNDYTIVDGKVEDWEIEDIIKLIEK